ncbi:MAG: hypothetical protein V7632_1777 [Bradyrhizobium sp.]|jgi:hypothetical protein
MTVFSDPRQWQVGLLGYGEVGRILAEDLRKQDVKVAAYDIRLDCEQGAPLRQHAASIGVELMRSHAELAVRADFIVSAVTASQAVAVAEACAPAIRTDGWFLDFNSASPGAKRRAAEYIDGAGGRYVEGAVMTSLPPHRIKVPLLQGSGGIRPQRRLAHRGRPHPGADQSGITQSDGVSTATASSGLQDDGLVCPACSVSSPAHAGDAVFQRRQ